jgi:hypothetical protein
MVQIKKQYGETRVRTIVEARKERASPSSLQVLVSKKLDSINIIMISILILVAIS